MAKTHWKNLANYDYLGSYSFDDGVNEIDITISSITREKVTAVGGNIDDCIVAHFVEKNVKGVVVKPMVLNKTNCKTIASLYETDYVEDWIGKRITVFVTTTKFARDIVPCLRVKKQKPEEVVDDTSHICSVCGKTIEKEIYNSSIKKYGVSLCSKKCLEKYQKLDQNEDENKGGNE